MTRIIKFRAWDKLKKKMFGVTGMHFSEAGELSSISIDTGSGELQDLSCDNFELMQFTGLYDKNGKEIYRGDIVKYYHYPKNMCVIRWDDELLSYKVTVVSEGVYCEDYFFIKSDSSKFQLIGNIYENPELIGTK